MKQGHKSQICKHKKKTSLFTNRWQNAIIHSQSQPEQKVWKQIQAQQLSPPHSETQWHRTPLHSAGWSAQSKARRNMDSTRARTISATATPTAARNGERAPARRGHKTSPHTQSRGEHTCNFANKLRYTRRTNEKPLQTCDIYQAQENEAPRHAMQSGRQTAKPGASVLPASQRHPLLVFQGVFSLLQPFQPVGSKCTSHQAESFLTCSGWLAVWKSH